ncbi:MAG: FGGY family carbohydrate kinase, partial [Spirochaetota bacterium]
MKKYLLGFDLGSSGAKGVIVDCEGRILSFCTAEHATIRLNPGWAEQDPENSWWESFKNVARRLLKNSGIAASQIKAVGITGFVPGLCPLDAEGRVVRNAIMHTDLRAQAELAFVNRTLSEQITLGNLIPKLLWFKDSEPENYAKTAKIVNPHAFLVYRLTGAVTCDYDTATLVGGLFDDAGLRWDGSACAKLGNRMDIWPDLFSAVSVVGGIVKQAAAETGLPDGTPVIAGTGDSFAALIGHGVISPGDLMIYLGSSGTQILVNNNLHGYINTPHFGPGKAEFAGRIVSCGDSMEHFRALLGHKTWETLNKGAAGLKPGSGRLIVVPHLKQKGTGESSFYDRETVFGL